MPSSIFDRLSQQGTVASRQRDAEEKQSRCLKNEQRRQMEVALTPSKNDKKLKALQRSPITAPQDQTNQKKQSIVASPKQKDALYDRLAKQDTISSAAHHGKSFQDNNNGAVLRTQCRKSPKRTDSERAATFDRLYKQDTASSKAHRHKQLPEETSFFSPKKTIAHTPPPSLLTRRLEVDSADTGPPIPLKINIYIRTNEEKKDGKPYNDHFDLTQKEVRKQINLYAASKISAKALAYEIINALFHRDFTPGRHWEVSSRRIEGRKIIALLTCLMQRRLRFMITRIFILWQRHQQRLRYQVRLCMLMNTLTLRDRLIIMFTFYLCCLYRTQI
jgi:hypothetical protein